MLPHLSDGASCTPTRTRDAGRPRLVGPHGITIGRLRLHTGLADGQVREIINKLERRALVRVERRAVGRASEPSVFVHPVDHRIDDTPSPDALGDTAQLPQIW